jgi:predicted TIM-barrel fold metal-dependent hydrolase
VNLRLAAECARHSDLFAPIGAVNPMLPDWEEELRRCHEDHKFPGIRLHPNYHGYKLDDPVFADLLKHASSRKLIVQIVDHVEDERTHHPLMQVPPVDWKPLAKVMEALPDAKVVLLNALRVARGEPLQSLTKIPNVWLDVACLEQVGGIANVLDRFPPERLLFGSYAPFFYPESAVQKLTESALHGEALEKICHQNAAGLITSGENRR